VCVFSLLDITSSVASLQYMHLLINNTLNMFILSLYTRIHIYKIRNVYVIWGGIIGTTVFLALRLISRWLVVDYQVREQEKMYTASCVYGSVLCGAFEGTSNDCLRLHGRIVVGFFWYVWQEVTEVVFWVVTHGRIPTFQRSMLHPSCGLWPRVVLW